MNLPSLSKDVKKSIFARLRNNFIAGVVVLIPIGITLYLTLFFIRISGKIIPKELNPNNYFVVTQINLTGPCCIIIQSIHPINHQSKARISKEFAKDK